MSIRTAFPTATPDELESFRTALEDQGFAPSIGHGADRTAAQWFDHGPYTITAAKYRGTGNPNGLATTIEQTAAGTPQARVVIDTDGGAIEVIRFEHHLEAWVARFPLNIPAAVVAAAIVEATR